MKKIQICMLLVLSVGLLTGCSREAKQYNKNTLIVKGNGSLVEVAVEDFKDSSISAGDLESYVEEQIDQYNADNGKVVKKSYINTDDMSKVKLVLTYKNIDSFNGFNLLECKLEKYSDVKESDLTGTFQSSEGKTVKTADFTDVDKADVLILSEATNVVVKGDILYYNEEVTIKDDVVTTSGEKDAVIIFK